VSQRTGIIAMMRIIFRSGCGPRCDPARYRAPAPGCLRVRTGSSCVG